MARREEPGIGVAGEGGGLGLAVDDGDLVAVAVQLVGRGDADDPRAQYQCLHRDLFAIPRSGC